MTPGPLHSCLGETHHLNLHDIGEKIDLEIGVTAFSRIGDDRMNIASELLQVLFK